MGKIIAILVDKNIYPCGMPEMVSESGTESFPHGLVDEKDLS